MALSSPINNKSRIAKKRCVAIPAFHAPTVDMQPDALPIHRGIHEDLHITAKADQIAIFGAAARAERRLYGCF
jgi:hypothetical protein